MTEKVEPKTLSPAEALAKVWKIKEKPEKSTR